MHPHCGASLPGADLDSIADLMHDPKFATAGASGVGRIMPARESVI